MGAPEVSGSAFPSVMEVAALKARHPTYDLFADEWRRLRLLHQGGVRLQNAAAEFLVSRPHEPRIQYEARLKGITYQDILGPALGWYLSALFRDGAQVDYTGAGGQGSTTLQPTTRRAAMGPTVSDGASVYAEFLEDADRSGHSLFEVARDAVEDAMLTGRAYLWVDFPCPDRRPETLLEERQMGLGRPHIVRLPPESVTNWGEDAYGNLEWLIVEDVRLGGTPFQTHRPSIRTWMVLDRTTYGLYQQDDAMQKTARLVQSGVHALSAAGRVPVERWILADTLCLGDRVYLPVVNHLNQENTLSWQLFMGNLAMPVIIADGPVSVAGGEATYLQLPAGSQYLWSEPEGRTIQASADRCNSLREEIYRQLHLQVQSRSNQATAAAQSGVSKELDYTPSKDMLDGFGDVIRPALKRLLQTIALAIGDQTAQFTVRGFTFSEGGGAALTKLNQGRLSGIPSDTLITELEKGGAMELLGDSTSEVKARVISEIEKAPTASERRAAEADAMASAMDARVAAITEAPKRKPTGAAALAQRVKGATGNE